VRFDDLAVFGTAASSFAFLIAHITTTEEQQRRPTERFVPTRLQGEGGKIESRNRIRNSKLEKEEPEVERAHLGVECSCCFVVVVCNGMFGNRAKAIRPESFGALIKLLMKLEDAMKVT